jgi:hypothetical protein
MGNLCLSDLDAILARPPTIQVEHLALQRVSLFRAMSWRLPGKRLSNYRDNRSTRCAPRLPARAVAKGSFILTLNEGLAGMCLLEWCLAARIYEIANQT